MEHIEQHIRTQSLQWWKGLSDAQKEYQMFVYYHKCLDGAFVTWTPLMVNTSTSAIKRIYEINHDIKKPTDART